MTPEQLTAIRARRNTIMRSGLHLEKKQEGIHRQSLHNLNDKEVAFIAAAPADIEALLAYVAELEAKLQEADDCIGRLNGKLLLDNER